MLNKHQIISELKEQILIAGHEPTAQFFAEKGEPKRFDDGSALILQGDTTDSVFFILAGRVDVFVNHRYVGSRQKREHVGEMALLHPALARSATVQAVGSVTALEVSSVDFIHAANKHPPIWLSIARTLAERLREREKLLRPKNPKPVIFIGCASESKVIADLVVQQFEYDKAKFDVVPWYHGVFGPSRYTIDDLMKQVDRADFALFVFHPEDVITSRGASTDAPRDNVVFELGLFMGRVGRERVFMLQPHGIDLKIPSDLTGMAPLKYTTGTGGPKPADMITPINLLKEIVLKEGGR